MTVGSVSLLLVESVVALASVDVASLMTSLAVVMASVAVSAVTVLTAFVAFVTVVVSLEPFFVQVTSTRMRRDAQAELVVVEVSIGVVTSVATHTRTTNWVERIFGTMSQYSVSETAYFFDKMFVGPGAGFDIVPVGLVCTARY